MFLTSLCLSFFPVKIEGCLKHLLCLQPPPPLEGQFLLAASKAFILFLIFNVG